MKRFLLSLIAVLALTVAVQAQMNVHPTTFKWVLEDSAGAKVWNIGATTDQDTSVVIDVFRMPETGLGFQFYSNQTTADTGQICFILEQNCLTSSIGAFGDSAVYAWIYVDSISVGLKPGDVATSTGRSSYSWNPTLIGPADEVRLIAIRRSGHVPRSVAILRTRQD